MNEEQFLQEIDRIARDYDQLTRRLIASSNTNQEEIYEAANDRLNTQLEAAFLAYTATLIPSSYLISADRTNSQISRSGVVDNEDLTQFIDDFTTSPYNNEITDILNDSTEIIQDVSRLSKTYKTELGQTIIRTKRSFDRDIRRAQRRIATAVEAGVSQRDIVKQIEEQFRNATDAIQEASGFMFRDSGGRRWTYNAYASMHTSTTAGNTALDATIDQMERVGGDIAQIPFNGATDDSCVPFQLKYVSVSGANAGKTFRGQVLFSLPELRQPGSGIFHPHCTHFGLIYVPLTPAEEEEFAI